MLPESKDTLIEYCFRELGYPVVEINVTEDQATDRIDEAINHFQLFHFAATEKRWVPYFIVQEDLDAGFLTIGEPIISVVSAICDTSTTGSGSMGDPIWHMKKDIYSALGFNSANGECPAGQLSNYQANMSKLATMEYMFENRPHVKYHQHSNHLYIDDDISSLKVGDVVLLDAYVIIDPETYANIWKDVWLMEFCTALIGRQWGNNLSKFQEVQLPGGITLNGDEMYNKYNERITELKEQLEQKYSFPPMMIIG